MGIRKNLIILGLLILTISPVNATQFKQWQGVIINKQAVSKIAPYTNKHGSYIRIYHMTGNSMGNGTTQANAFYTTLSYKTDTERNNALRHLLQWLNEKD